jgi:phosphoribosyl 1,2-cyclic phosphodiesterase
MMEVTIWGARGSIPSPGPHTVRYGGNTPCLEVRGSDGTLLVLDAGTGIRALGDTLALRGQPVTAEVIITHAHWDHVQGLPFFAPLYTRGNRVRIRGAGGAAEAVQRVVRGQMAHETFPIAFESLPADVAIGALPPVAEVGGLRVEYLEASHQGGAVGFRVREGNASGPALVYFPDSELGAPEAHGLGAGWHDRLREFVGGAALLVHDAMYTEAEYASHAGWGHSHMREVVRMAEDVGVRTLALFHHHPGRTDDALDGCLARSRSEATPNGALEVVMATEGATLTTR